MEIKEIIAELIKNRKAEFTEKVKVEGVKVTPCTSEETGEIYYRVALTTDKPVKTMRANDDATFSESTINVVMELFSNLLLMMSIRRLLIISMSILRAWKFLWLVVLLM